jgi:hypothetical protein
MRPTALRSGLLGLVCTLVWAPACTGVLAQSKISSPDPAALEMVNRASVPITDARLASRAMGDWGPNLLATAVSAGDRRKLVPLRQEGCLYAVRITYQGGRYERFEMMDLCSNHEFMFGAKTASPVSNQSDFNAPPASKITFVNGSSKTLSVLRMSPTHSRAWGVDRLGDRTLAAGQSYSVALDPSGGCHYRIRAFYEDSLTEIFRSVDLCDQDNVVLRRATTYTNDQIPADMRLESATAITIANQSGMQIDSIFVFLPNDRDPGPDRLGNDVLLNGRQTRINVSDLRQCTVTVVGVYREQREERTRLFDLCSGAASSLVMRGPTGIWPFNRRR